MIKCMKCIHFKPARYNIDFASSTGTCKKFSKKHEEFAGICRIDELKCGKEGKYFVEERNLNLKIFTHVFISSIPNTLVVSLLVLEYINILKYNEKY